MEEKRFSEWMGLKNNLHFGKKSPDIKEGEIWWCGLGENVGVEINGKSTMFARPVVIMKKLSKFGFMAVPLTSKEKTGSWYVEFEFQNKREFAALCQARFISVSRLYNKMGTLPDSDLKKIKEGFLKLYQ